MIVIELSHVRNMPQNVCAYADQGMGQGIES